MSSPLIGLTGGIGCGKTEVARIFERLGAIVIDADRLGRHVVESDAAVRSEIRRAFGEAFFDFQGRLQRQLLGTFVFSNPERVKQLNAIVHPHLLQAMRARIDETQKNNPPMILVDAALIYEAEIADTFDKVIVVTADEKIRMTRIMARDQIQSEDAMLRIRVQMPIEEKERRADYVLTNNTSLADLNRKVEALFDTLVNNNKR